MWFQPLSLFRFHQKLGFHSLSFFDSPYFALPLSLPLPPFGMNQALITNAANARDDSHAKWAHRFVNFSNHEFKCKVLDDAGTLCGQKYSDGTSANNLVKHLKISHEISHPEQVRANRKRKQEELEAWTTLNLERLVIAFAEGGLAFFLLSSTSF